MQESDAEPAATEGPSAAALSFGGLTDFCRAMPEGVANDPLTPGTRLGDVTVVRFIAAGGMGRVYEGLQGVPCRTVAVKAIHPGVLSPAAAKRFEHEAHILGRLNDPGIARIYSMGMQPLGGCLVPYFVMEYVEDALPITAFAENRKLTERERVDLFRDACRAVAHGHLKGVVHRDLKPGNILVDATGQPKIIDFGVARCTDGDVALTTMHTDVGQLVGTLQYMSPEQFDGVADEIDTRSDVYSLGIVLYELLAGRPPYDIAKRPFFRAAQIVREQDPPSLSTTKPRLAGDISTIVATCLEKDRSRRYSTAAELEADLGRYLRGEPITANPPWLVDSVVRLARRHRRAAITASCILATVCVALVAIGLFAVRAENQRNAAERERRRADATAELARQRLYVANLRSIDSFLQNDNLRMARQTYDENLALVVGPLPLEMRCLRARLDEALVTIDLRSGPVTSIEYSSDGGLLSVRTVKRPKTSGAHTQALAGNHGLLRDVSRTQAHRFRVAPRHGYDVMGDAVSGGKPDRTVEWDYEGVPLDTSEDGARIAVHGFDGRVRIVCHGRPSEPEAVLEGLRGRIATLSFAAKGRSVVAATPDGGFGIWDADTGASRSALETVEGKLVTFLLSPHRERVAVIIDQSNVLARRVYGVALYDAASGRRLAVISLPQGLGPSDSVAVFSPDGTRLATASRQNDIDVWSAFDGAKEATIQGHRAAVTTIAFSPDGARIAAGATNGRVKLWDSRTFVLEREWMGHEAAVDEIAFHPDGTTLASGAVDGTVRIWSAAVSPNLGSLPGSRPVTAVAFHPGGRQLAVAFSGDGIELWDAFTVEQTHRLEGAAVDVADLRYSPDGFVVAAACRSPSEVGDVGVWRTDTGTLVASCGQEGHGAKAVVFSADGSRVLSSSASGAACVWDSRTGRAISKIAPFAFGRPFADGAAVFGLGGKRLAFRVPELFDSETGEVAVKLLPQGQVTCHATSPDGRVLAAGFVTGVVYLTDFATGARLGKFVGNSDGVVSIAFSRDGRLVATGGVIGDVRLWDAFTGEMVHRFHGHDGRVEWLEFAADGRRLVTAATDGTVRIWGLDIRQELCVLPGNREWPKAVAMSPDGTRLVTAGSAGCRIWGLSNAGIVTARREAVAAPCAAAPRASPETQPSHPDPGG